MNRKYTAAIVGHSEKDDTILKLKDHGYEVFILPGNESIDTPVRSHADLSVFILKNRLIVSGDYYHANKELIDRICSFASLLPCASERSSYSPYPHDVTFCALNCSDTFVIANTKYISHEIYEICASNSIPIIHTAQGYAKCTSVYFNGCLISADASSLKAAESIGFKTLEISSGAISLPGYDCGFIGGCCGFDGENIYFCGDIDTHPNAESIKKFANANGADVISLGSHGLYDIGSILFI